MTTSPFKKSILFLSLFAAAVTVAVIDIYLPAAPYLAYFFNVDFKVIQFSLSLSPFVGAFSGLFYGYYSDAVGRRRPFIFGSLLLILGSILCAFSNNIYFFLIGRLIQSIGSGGVSVLSVCLLNDHFQGPNYRRYISIYGMIFPIVFAIAPLIGAYLLKYFGWRSNFIFLTWLSVILLFLVCFWLKEHGFKHIIPSSTKKIKQQLLSFMGNRNFLTYGLAHSLPVVTSIVLVASSSFLLIQVYGYSPICYSYVNFVWSVFNLIGSVLFFYFVKRVPSTTCLRYALYSQIVSVFFFGIFAVCHIHHPAIITVGVMFLQLSMSTSISTCFKKSIDSVSHIHTGFATSLLSFSRNLIVSLVMIQISFLINTSFRPIFFECMIFILVNIFLCRHYLKKEA
jgi:DHA1 family bicyclomycin/chloramphenicol resistance-like MFS transporter